MNRIKSISNETNIYIDNVAAYTFSTGSVVSSQTRYTFGEQRNFEADPVTVCGFRMIPYGANNELPTFIRNVMEKNHLAPGVINREVGLIYGAGPQLYSLHYANGELHRDYRDDKEIWKWLRSWDYRRYIEMAMVEYKYLNGFFSRQFRNQGVRVGAEPKIAKLEVVPAVNCRLEWVDSQCVEDVKRIFVGQFADSSIYRTGVVPYPVFDRYNPFARPVSMSYHNTYTFGRNFYSLPSYYGTLPWIMRSSDIPEIIKYLTENGISVAYHVHVPNGYWDGKKAQIEMRYPQLRDDEVMVKLEELKEETFDAMSNVLAGKKNAGKFITTIDFVDPDSRQILQWKIEPIDQQIKDFIEAQIKISGEAQSATTSGLGLHPALSNVLIQGKLASGSEMLYALKLYLASDVSLAEEVIFENINQCIAANFPNSDLRLGFYHPIVKSTDEENPDERLKNVI